MKPRAIALKELKANGFVLSRHGARHDIFLNRELNTIIPLKRHDFNENDLKYIQKEIRNAKQR